MTNQEIISIMREVSAKDPYAKPDSYGIAFARAIEAKAYAAGQREALKFQDCINSAERKEANRVDSIMKSGGSFEQFKRIRARSNDNG